MSEAPLARRAEELVAEGVPYTTAIRQALEEHPHVIGDGVPTRSPLARDEPTVEDLVDQWQSGALNDAAMRALPTEVKDACREEVRRRAGSVGGDR